MPQPFPLKEIVERHIVDWRTGACHITNAVVVEDYSPARMEVNPAFVLSPGTGDWYRIKSFNAGHGGETTYFPCGVVRNKDLIPILNGHLRQMRVPGRAVAL